MIKEHEGGCMCDSCQGGNNISLHEEGCMCGSCQGGNDSGYELAPDSNPQIPPHLLNNPDIINSIITQVLQQVLQDDTITEQGGVNDLTWQGFFPGDEPVVTDPSAPGTGTVTQALNPVKTDWVANNDQIAMWPQTKYPTINDPCNKKAMVAIKTKWNDYMTGVLSNPGPPVKTIPGQNTMGESSLQEKIKNKFTSLFQEQELEEGSCGYTQTADGQNLTTPGETSGMDATTRTQQMQYQGRKNLQERFQQLAGIKSI